MKCLGEWNKLGRLLAPSKELPWMSTYSGSASVLPNKNSSRVTVYVTGRDNRNRSSIGQFTLDLESSIEILDIKDKPVLSFGERGTFDENGVSYPYVVANRDKIYMFYTGWMPTVLTPFQNHLGLAVRCTDGSFSRVSKVPIMDRNHDDPLCIGSACVIHELGHWQMWYTSFLKWGEVSTEPKHYYHIKYAESEDGILWRRPNKVCVSFENKEEFAIGKPSVVKINNTYHMWFCHRGSQYRIGYAYSTNGKDWTRKDEWAGIGLSEEGWDSESICYPYVFRHKDNLFMLYCGNKYGKEGLGIAKLNLN